LLVVGHSCVLSWWRAVHGTAAPPEWNRYRVAVTAGLHAADVVATPTRALLDELRHIYGFDGATAVIPNGCAPVDAPVRDAHRAPVLLAAGRMWDEAKNMTTLAAAARRLERTVHVAGAAVAPDGTALVPPDLHALGPLPHADLCGWYRRASIFIHPALYEPFGLAPLEAALHGCALVLGDIPTLREVWGDAATFVPPRDDAALADAIADLAADPERASARGDAARARALHYDAERMARAYHTLYGAMLAGTTEALACAS
jgi:glycogen synthase